MLRLDETFHNPVKQLLKENKKVLGAWLQMASPYAAEIFAKAGVDVLMVDMEHAPNDPLTLLEQLRAMGRFDAVPFARAPNLKSYPTCRYEGAWPLKVFRRNSSGLDAEKRCVNGSTTTASTPLSESVLIRSSLVMSFLRRSGWNTSSGSMSNVSATLAPPFLRAVSCAQESRY